MTMNNTSNKQNQDGRTTWAGAAKREEPESTADNSSSAAMQPNSCLNGADTSSPLHEEIAGCPSGFPPNPLKATNGSTKLQQVTTSAQSSSGDDGSSGSSYRRNLLHQEGRQQQLYPGSNVFSNTMFQVEPPPAAPPPIPQLRKQEELLQDGEHLPPPELESLDKPATVVATSRRAPVLYHSESNGTTTSISSSSSSSGSGGEGRDVRDLIHSSRRSGSGHYHTIRRVLTRSQHHGKKYRASSSDTLSSSSLSSSSSSASAGEEGQKIKEKQSLNVKMMARKGKNLSHRKRKRLDGNNLPLIEGSKASGKITEVNDKQRRRERLDDDYRREIMGSNASPESSSNEDESSSIGSRHGSGTDCGYAGSASSNGTVVAAAKESSYSSPSETSSEESQVRSGGRSGSRRHKKSNKDKKKRARQSSSRDRSSIGFSSSDSSSEIADFSSGSGRDTSEDSDMAEDVGDARRNPEVVHHASVSFNKSHRPSLSPELSSSSFDDEEDNYNDGMCETKRTELEDAFLSAKRAADAEHEQLLSGITKKRKASTAGNKIDCTGGTNSTVPSNTLPSKRFHVAEGMKGGRPPIMTVGCDIMAHVLTFLEPPEILEKLTLPLSKSWQRSFTSQSELWRVLCLVEPFKATISCKSKKDPSNDDDDDEGNTSSCSDSYYSLQREVDKSQEKVRLDRYRSLYTSFVRCMKYLSQIREDARNGRTPKYIDYGTHMAQVPTEGEQAALGDNGSATKMIVAANEDLQRFLAEARDVVLRSNPSVGEGQSGESGSASATTTHRLPGTVVRMTYNLQKKKRLSQRKSNGAKRKPEFASSVITGRLLGPSDMGDPGNMNLPWSCAIYSIMNWMVAYADVEGIQTLCLKVMPDLLENDQQRMTAQSAGITDIVLKAMLIFPHSVELHISAFHTLVLLARPMGGREGMLFRSSMTANGIFGPDNPHHGRSGIGIMLDSMNRFKNSTALLAMSCWALVNIALNPTQKKLLVKLGGIQAVADAMRRHPFDAEVQFRALFALINLVIPSPRSPRNRDAAPVVNRDQRGEHQQGEEVEGHGPGAEIRRAADAAAVAAPLLLNSEEDDEPTERCILDATVGDVASLVVKAMKNFCSCANILDRACLVLHNLSLNQDYHTILLWTPNLYQMLEWSIANYRTSSLVLTQSASAALQRLQNTLARNATLRGRFRQTLKTQQTIALERAHDEARRLIEEQEALAAVRIAEQQEQAFEAAGASTNNDLGDGGDNDTAINDEMMEEELIAAH